MHHLQRKCCTMNSGMDAPSQTVTMHHGQRSACTIRRGVFIQAFARSMKRRKVNSPIKDYANIQELTPEILDATIERIEISHVNYHSKPGSVIHIYWKLK